VEKLAKRARVGIAASEAAQHSCVIFIMISSSWMNVDIDE